MIDLYLTCFHQGHKIRHLLDHLVIVTLDQKAQDRCLQLHPHCFMLGTIGVDFSGEKLFMTKDYLRMMWRRIKFLEAVLTLEYSFIFSVQHNKPIDSHSKGLISLCWKMLALC